MTIFSILFAIILFSLLIFVHELGHFVAAKLSGVQVNEFSMFMGPAIYKKQKGETLYSIRCIPLGGYCAMEGEDEDTDNPRSFQKAAWWKRLIILVAGSFMNLVAGILLLMLVFSFNKGFSEPVISYAEPGCTVVSEEGLHIGDRFVEVNGEKIFTASDVSMMLSFGGETQDLVVLRDGQKVYLTDFVMETHSFVDETTGQEEIRYGFSFDYADFSVGKLLEYTWKNTCSVVQTVWISLKMLVTGKAGLSDMTGPVGIVQVMSTTAEASDSAGAAILNMLYFGGFIAINLAVMNLLPIPALDGGRCVGLLLTTAIEKITKKKLDPKYEGYIHGIFMILLLILMAVIMFKDIFVIFKR